MASTLSAGLKAAAGTPKAATVLTSRTSATPGRAEKAAGTVLIGAHYAPEVRRALLLVQAQPENTGKNLKDLLGEAINDLCAKYGQPQPYLEQR